MGGTMPNKSTRLLILVAVTALAMLMFSGCGKSGSKFANQAPTIRITSYEGYDDSELLAPYENVNFLFQQKIFWNATDPDGVITGFAYRVKDQDGNPIATPGNHFIDTDGSVTPDNVIARFGTGWVLHYKSNADQDIPLDDPAANRTIWTSAKYATINFPASDANGNPLTMNSTFEVIAIDNRGDITALDPNYPATSIAWRKFNATSARPTCIISTTKGNPNGGEVGSGIRLDFTMHDSDPFIPETPFKFEFRMMKVDPVTEAVIAGTESQWYNSVTTADPELNRYLLTRYTSPSILGTTNAYDIEGSVTNTKTKIQARAYDLAGVVSAVNDSSSLYFAVKAGFRPETLVYPQRVYALGDNHYIDYTDESTPEILPFTFINGVQRFATPFFKNMEGVNTAINSTNTKVWLRWGWKGEYGVVPATGPIIYTNNPYDKKIDTVLDRATNMNYFSEITHFHLRLDGQPYNYQPYANSIVTDTEGLQWLRIPQNSPLGQTVVLTAMTSGTHTLQVRCEDLQGEVDPIPAEITFTLVSAIPAANRSGILVIDDDRQNASTSPEPTVLEKYQQMLADYTGTVQYIKRTNAQETGDTFADFRLRHLATSDLQNYKLVIYHSDNPSESGSLKNENDGLTLYLKSGGNILISHTSKLASVLDAFVLANQKTFVNYLGIPPFVSPPAAILSDALQTRPFFQKAVGANGFPDIDLQYGTTGQPGASFNPLVNNFQGLATITYFPTYSAQAAPIYSMGIKPVGFVPAGPTQAQYDLYNGKTIGVRHVTNITRCYLLGFPLSYMQADDAKGMINQVLSELGMI